MKKQSIDREPIALRAKVLASGRRSLYLDYYMEYKGGHKNHSHTYEFLKLYLLPETSRENKQKNKATMQVAKAIQAQRLIERANGKAHIRNNGSKILLSDYMKHYAEVKRKYGQSESGAILVESVANKLNGFRPDIIISQVNKAFCNGFITYLKNCDNSNATKKHKGLSNRTVKIYFSILSSALSLAVKEDVIPYNPADKVTKEERKVYAFDSNTRTYLTIDEVRKLASTPCHREDVKNAFLFACFCGLRISDIVSLTWSEIYTDETGAMFIRKMMKKTQKEIILPIPTNAVAFLPKREGMKVFDLGTKRNVNITIKKWAKNAGIEKDICFHVSRHTFATTLLTLGADLYTTSKLMGHSKIQTTQIYAEIVNKKKQEAINLLDNINLNLIKD